MTIVKSNYKVKNKTKKEKDKKEREYIYIFLNFVLIELEAKPILQKNERKSNVYKKKCKLIK